MNLNIWGDFQICISVPLKKKEYLSLVISSTNVVRLQNWWCDLCLKYNKSISILFIRFLYCAKKSNAVENIESDVVTLKIDTTMQKW